MRPGLGCRGDFLAFATIHRPFERSGGDASRTPAAIIVYLSWSCTRRCRRVSCGNAATLLLAMRPPFCNMESGGHSGCSRGIPQCSKYGERSEVGRFFVWPASLVWHPRIAGFLRLPVIRLCANHAQSRIDQSMALFLEKRRRQFIQINAPVRPGVAPGAFRVMVIDAGFLKLCGEVLTL